MKLLFLCLIILVGCGKENDSTCISRESKILECQAIEAAANYFNTAQMLEFQKEKCERSYPVNKCY